MLHKFKLIALPSIKFIKELLSKCSQDANLKTFFDKLSPEQRLINIFFEEVELTLTHPCIVRGTPKRTNTHDQGYSHCCLLKAIAKTKHPTGMSRF